MPRSGAQSFHHVTFVRKHNEGQSACCVRKIVMKLETKPLHQLNQPGQLPCPSPFMLSLLPPGVPLRYVLLLLSVAPEMPSQINSVTPVPFAIPS